MIMEARIEALVDKAKQGDTDAFGILYQYYYSKMKGVCIKILKENKDVVDDLVQDAFILALVSISKLKNNERFSQWLTSITTNLALKYHEKSSKVHFVSLSSVYDDPCNNYMEDIVKTTNIYTRKFYLQ